MRTVAVSLYTNATVAGDHMKSEWKRKLILISADYELDLTVDNIQAIVDQAMVIRDKMGAIFGYENIHTHVTAEGSVNCTYRAHGMRYELITDSDLDHVFYKTQIGYAGDGMYFILDDVDDIIKKIKEEVQ